jgi:prepilin-type N-terminal cleavage/methylation domain-containing protein
MSKRKQQAGFSLIEITIVLIVVALLMAGVMKGFAMVESAKIHTARAQIEQLQAGWVGFQARFRRLPGDTSKNGQLDEGEKPWQDLANAGYVAENQAAGMLHPWGEDYTLTFETLNGVAGHFLCLPSVDGLVGMELDAQLDDGLANDGSLQAKDAQNEVYVKGASITLCKQL